MTEEEPTNRAQPAAGERPVLAFLSRFFAQLLFLGLHRIFSRLAARAPGYPPRQFPGGPSDQPGEDESGDQNKDDPDRLCDYPMSVIRKEILKARQREHTGSLLCGVIP